MTADDPDGQAVRVQAIGLPTTTTYDDTSGNFELVATAALRGERLVRFVASDGVAQNQLIVTIYVTENRPLWVGWRAR